MERAPGGSAVKNLPANGGDAREEVKLLSRVQLFAIPWTVALQAPPSMGFSRQEYWSALPFPSPGDLPNPGIESGSPALQADALPSEPPGKTHNQAEPMRNEKVVSKEKIRSIITFSQRQLKQCSDN